MLRSVGLSASARALERVIIAEEEIAAAKTLIDAPTEELHKRQEFLVHASFQLLCPPPILREHVSDVYRVHARELIERARTGENTRYATKAEVFCGLLAASLKAPLRSNGQALAEQLFVELFPEKAKSMNWGFTGEAREGYPGELAELLADARKKLAMTDRVMKT